MWIDRLVASMAVCYAEKNIDACLRWWLCGGGHWNGRYYSEWMTIDIFWHVQLHRTKDRVKYRVNGKRTELLVHYTNQYNNRQQNVANQKMEKHPIRSHNFFSFYQKNPETSYISSYASCVSICRFYFSVFFSLISLFSSGFNLFTKWIAWRAHTVSSSSSSTLLSNIKSQHRFELVILVGREHFYHIILYCCLCELVEFVHWSMCPIPLLLLLFD